MGLPDLKRPGDHEAVEVGNAIMAFSAKAFTFCCRSGTPVSMESPATSRLWLCPQMLAVLRRKDTTLVTTEFCMWGKPWRKSTSFMCANLDASRLGERRCLHKPRGCCKRTLRPHRALEGIDPVSKMFWTKIAEPYPASLSSALAKCFEDALLQKRATNFCKFLKAARP